MNAVPSTSAFDVARAATAGFQLEDQGYCVIRDLIPRLSIERVASELDADFARTPFCRGPFYGETTKRFGRVLARSRSAAALALQPMLLSLAHRVLDPWCDTIQLNVAQAIEIHPDAPAQFPHRDQDMWRGVGAFEHLVNVIWPLTSFTAHNGATLLWPDTHGARAAEPCSGDAIVAEAEPGDAIVFLGSILHGAGANLSSSPRRGIVIGYSLGWLRTYENQSLAYPPAIARHFPPELAELVGYRQHRPNLGNFEGQCPSVLLDGHEDAPLPAIDGLRPDQSAELARYVLEQRARQGVEAEA